MTEISHHPSSIIHGANLFSRKNSQGDVGLLIEGGYMRCKVGVVASGAARTSGSITRACMSTRSARASTHSEQVRRFFKGKAAPSLISVQSWTFAIFASLIDLCKLYHV